MPRKEMVELRKNVNEALTILDRGQRGGMNDASSVPEDNEEWHAMDDAEEVVSNYDLCLNGLSSSEQVSWNFS